MSFQIIQEAAEAGANQTLGNDYSDYQVIDLVNDICDSSWTPEDAIGKLLVVTYTSADAYMIANGHVQEAYDKAVKYAMERAEEHPYWRDVESHYADYDDPRRTQH